MNESQTIEIVEEYIESTEKFSFFPNNANILNQYYGTEKRSQKRVKSIYPLMNPLINCEKAL